jgi:phage tail-like protein
MPPEANPVCRFYVEIGAEKQGVFTEVSGLQAEMDVMTYEEGGNNDFVHRLPGRTKMGNLTLKRGMTNSNAFFKWFAQIARGHIKRTNLSVVLYDVSGKELLRWTFVNAYPVKWTGPQFTADGSGTAIETLELAHDGLKPG